MLLYQHHYCNYFGRPSVAEALESKRVDPELILENLGFAKPDCSLLGRLPARFLCTAQRDQPLVDLFISTHPEFQKDEDAEAMKGETHMLLTTPIKKSPYCNNIYCVIALISCQWVSN